ncbi:MAG: GatB/YqeY domain-containing protein [Ignavibacteriae bacterium]|nr:GatB/YqeY domain-containing protein [Ignavibacteriota bacterium]
MTLSEKINDDMKAALKGGRKTELETLRTIRAAILEVEKKKIGTVLGEDDELAVLTAAAKKRREAIESYSSAGRHDLAEQEKAELEVIVRYLPQQLTSEELESLAKEAIAAAGAADMKDFGKVMGPLMKSVKGRADGAAVQAMIRRLLGGV